jgi:hypothetical protein
MYPNMFSVTMTSNWPDSDVLHRELSMSMSLFCTSGMPCAGGASPHATGASIQDVGLVDACQAAAEPHGGL